MHTRATILIASLLTGWPLIARPKVDVITMANGDRITGEIKGLNGGVLRVDLDYVDGTISLQWMKVARVESPQLFIVQTQDGSSYSGTLYTSPSEANKIHVTDLAQSAVTIEHARVVRLEETADTFIHRLNGEISLGLVYSKGNNSTQNTFGSAVDYRRERWGVQADFDSNLSSSSGATTSTRNQVDLLGYHLMTPKNYFYGAIAGFLQSSVQGISRQTTLGGGIGCYFKNTNRARISVLAGAVMQNTRYEQSKYAIPAEQSGAGLIAAELKVFVFKKTNLAIESRLFPSFTEGGRVRLNANASYYLKVVKNLNWNLSFYGNWDTRPPANFSGADYGYSVGLKWTFGYR